MLDWLDGGKSDYNKLKMLYYDKNYRGVHAKVKIYVKIRIFRKFQNF